MVMFAVLYKQGDANVPYPQIRTKWVTHQCPDWDKRHVPLGEIYGRIVRSFESKRPHSVFGGEFDTYA